MKKIALALILTTAMAGTAQADYYHRHGGYRGGHGGGWVAPLIGGMILGGAIYGLSQPTYAAPPPVYVTPPTRTECEFQPVYDRYGNYRGDRRVCFQVPNY